MGEIDARPLTADSTRLPATYGLTLHWTNEGLLILIPSRAGAKIGPSPSSPTGLFRHVLGYRSHKSWTPLDQISAHLVRAVIAGEDTRFCSHRGFDWSAIETAWDRYHSRRGRSLGASTISMQTAKNVFLWPGRDWFRKAFEAYFTVLIEVAWGKQRIMEVYLNVAE